MKTYSNIVSLWAVSLALLFNGCREQDDMKEALTRTPIQIAADYNTTTRVSDAGFADGDRMGVFITDYENGVPQPIGVSGNRANNVLFTYQESGNTWTGAAPIYWKDSQTPIDVVGYYPFNDELSSVTAYPFSVQTHQEAAAANGGMGGYEASDLLWAKNVQVAPTDQTIRLLYHHLMAGVTIRIEKGEGFAENEWESAVRQIWIDSTVPDALVDLEKGTVTAGSGEPELIVPLPYKDEYRAVVVPQEVAAQKPLIGLTVNGTNYALSKEEVMTYTSGKMHTFTIQVNKRTDNGDYEFSLMGEAVTAWIDDPDFHDGLIREYVTVEVEQPGTFEQCLKDRKLNAEKLSSLKVTGSVSWKDLQYMGSSMPALAYLNLKDVRIDDEEDANDDVITGFQNCASLTRVILPDRLRGIGAQAFYRTNLTGSLDIPEGVTFIEYGAFIDCPFHAGIEFPSTLKRIDSDAFAYADLTGELHLPEGVESIGGGAFNEAAFYGQLTLPQSLKDLNASAFASCNFSGDLVIPQGIRLTGSFSGNEFTHLEFPEGYETVTSQMFDGVPLQGELLLPASLKNLEYACFRGTKISSVVLPEGLRQLEKSTFADCSRLEGTITIPDNIVVVQEELFSGCSMLSGVHLHDEIVYIGKGAFRNCYNMNSIVCDALTPPTVEEGAFDGVPKDNFSVEVPASAVSAYKTAEGWKEFKRITPYSNFVCRPATACALNTMHEETLILNADGAWEVSYQPDWCKLSVTSGTGRTAIRLTINEMSHGAGDRKDSIVFALNGTEFTTYCTVQQKDYEYEEDELVELQKHTAGKGINILFLGDGYDAEALASGAYLDLAREEMEHFFALPPYDRLRSYFNVYAAVSLSQETGINTVNTYRNTRFGTIYGGSEMCGGSGPNLIPDDEQIFPYITETLTDLPSTENDLRRMLVILIPNTSEYNGVTYLYEDGRAISICPRSEQAYPMDTRGVVQREAGGFGFGKLANEAVTKNAYATVGVLNTIEEGHSRGWYQNISTTGKLSEVPWAHFIFDPRYSDYVDVFEGAFEYTRNVYRSEASSCMNTGIPYYNAISRQTITQRIKEYAGETFDLNEFYENDTNAWGTTRGRSDNGYIQTDVTATGKFKMPVIVKGKYIPHKPKCKNK